MTVALMNYQMARIVRFASLMRFQKYNTTGRERAL